MNAKSKKDTTMATSMKSAKELIKEGCKKRKRTRQKNKSRGADSQKKRRRLGDYLNGIK